MLKVLLSLFILTKIHASIVGADDRHEIGDAPLEIQDIAKSIAALVPKRAIEKLPNGNFKLLGLNYVEELNFCSDARFVNNQRLIANCSAFLIAPNKIGTAGHCIDDSMNFSIQDYYVVFDYKMSTHSNFESILSKDQVFEINKTIQREFNFPGDIDVAVLKLKRTVENRAPLQLSKERIKKGEAIYILGFPFGLPMKYQDNGFVTRSESNFGGKDSFTHNLDIFSVNSGSAIFREDSNQIVGILVRGSGPNYEERKEEKCNDWGGLINRKDHFGEGNYIDLLKF
jgi:V8-like Glu-specific endopeptidase